MSASTPEPTVPTPDDERRLLETVPVGLLLDGWRPAEGGRTFAVRDPATGAVLREVADASAPDAREALRIAHEAGPAWAAATPRARADVLGRAYELLVARDEELALLITLEMGKPLAEARAEVAYGADFVRWYAEEAVRLGGRYGPSPDGRSRIVTTRQPVGVCVLITPWNFPLAMATRKIAPALAAGCTVVVKPAALTPLTTLLVADILREAGVPDGVVTVVPTTDPGGVVEPLLRDPRTRKLSFTGSTGIGRRLAAESAQRLLRTSMELGGNAPFVVFDDADIERAVAGAVLAKLRNGGQSCTAANRYLVQDGIADAFVERFADALAGARVGRGTEGGVDVGPLINEAAVSHAAALVEDAVAGGARALSADAVALPDLSGTFFAPTVLDRVAPGARALTEEIFAPVAPIVRFADEAEALRHAHDTDYGLVGYVFTRDLDRAVRFGEALRTGMVGINQGIVSNAAAPFGGVGQSGMGREGGPEGLDEYTDLKYLALAVPDSS